MSVAVGDGARIEAICENLSLGGMFVACEQPIAVGHQLRVWLELPNAPPLFMTATVIWTTDAGFGLAQQLLGARDTFDLSEYLASLTDDP